MTEDSRISSNSISEYVEYAVTIIEKYPQMNEENTKWKLIREFLELLGWDVAFDAELEYAITIGNSSTYHVDYSLSGTSSTPVLFVETKGYDTTLTDQHRSQLHSYLRQTDVNWGLLTNGRSYEIYRREIADNDVHIRSIVRLTLKDLPQHADHINLLSKDALESGLSQELAQRIIDLRQAKQTLQDEKEEITDDVTRVVTDAAGTVLSQNAKKEAKILIDRLIETLETRAESYQNAGSPSAELKGNTDLNHFWNDVEQATGIRRTESSVELVDDHTAKESYIEFISYLSSENHPTHDDLPFGNGRKRYVLNSENSHKDGTEMVNPAEISDGIFVETHNSTDFKKRRIIELGELVCERIE